MTTSRKTSSIKISGRRTEIYSLWTMAAKIPSQGTLLTHAHRMHQRHDLVFQWMHPYIPEEQRVICHTIANFLVHLPVGQRSVQNVQWTFELHGCAIPPESAVEQLVQDIEAYSHPGVMVAYAKSGLLPVLEEKVAPLLAVQWLFYRGPGQETPDPLTHYWSKLDHGSRRTFLKDLDFLLYDLSDKQRQFIEDRYDFEVLAELTPALALTLALKTSKYETLGPSDRDLLPSEEKELLHRVAVLEPHVFEQWLTSAQHDWNTRTSAALASPCYDVWWTMCQQFDIKGVEDKKDLFRQFLLQPPTVDHDQLDALGNARNVPGDVSKLFEFDGSTDVPFRPGS